MLEHVTSQTETQEQSEISSVLEFARLLIGPLKVLFPGERSVKVPINVLSTHRMAGDGPDLVQRLGQTVLDLTIIQREEVSRAGQVPLTQN